MSVRAKLPKGLLKALDAAEMGLRSFIEDEREAFEAMSESWQEGDRAADVSDWLDTLEQAVDALAECQESAF